MSDSSSVDEVHQRYFDSLDKLMPESALSAKVKLDSCDSHATVLGRVPGALLFRIEMLVSAVAELQFTPYHAPLHGSLPSPQPELLIQAAPPVLLYSSHNARHCLSVSRVLQSVVDSNEQAEAEAKDNNAPTTTSRNSIARFVQ